MKSNNTSSYIILQVVSIQLHLFLGVITCSRCEKPPYFGRKEFEEGFWEHLVRHIGVLEVRGWLRNHFQQHIQQSSVLKQTQNYIFTNERMNA